MTDSPTAGEEVEKSFCRPASWEITRVSSVLFPARELLLSEWLLVLSIISFFSAPVGACRAAAVSADRSRLLSASVSPLVCTILFPRTPDFAPRCLP